MPVVSQPITSRQNPLVADFRGLAAKPDPDGTRLLLDGVHLIHDALRAGLAFECVAVDTERLARSDDEVGALARTLLDQGAPVVAVSASVLTAMTPVRQPTGIVAIARRNPVELSSLLSTSGRLLLVAVDVQDPGNLGALLRAAEAGGVDGAIVCGTSAHPFGWKALRGSMGSALRLPVARTDDITDLVVSLAGMHVRTIASVARGGSDPDALDWTGSVALLVGGEGPGLPQAVVDACTARVTIPMAPEVESLNVAMAGAVLVYAARRQRA